MWKVKRTVGTIQFSIGIFLVIGLCFSFLADTRALVLRLIFLLFALLNVASGYWALNTPRPALKPEVKGQDRLPN